MAARKGPRAGAAKGSRTKPRRKRDAVDEAFGPGAEETVPEPESARGPLPAFACGGERCVFRPATDLVSRFAAQLGPRHIRSLSHAATSGIELMKALRDFLDEEISIAERAAGKRRDGAARYSKIAVD